MGKATGFLELDRQVESYREVDVRINDYDEIFSGSHNLDLLQEQGSRCMDCGVPFCQSSNGCPIDNLIPEWNDLDYKNEWQEALERLEKTNNFPEFTGRVCPAPCEGIFYFGDKYSKPMGASVDLPGGKKDFVKMGSYGIGVSTRKALIKSGL